MTEEKDLSMFIVTALNYHGVFFKKAVRDKLKKIKNVAVVGEEYPVYYQEKGGTIDLLIEVNSPENKFVIPVECKRGYTEKKEWIFFKDPDKETKLLYIFNQKELTTTRANDLAGEKIEICIEGISLDKSKLDKKIEKAASTSSILEAGTQICAQFFGFLTQEINERNKNENEILPNFVTFPMIVTTSPLYICLVKKGAIDLLSGRLTKNFKKKNIPWLILRHPFVNPPTSGSIRIISSSYRGFQQRQIEEKEGVAIVNVKYLNKFFTKILQA